MSESKWYQELEKGIVNMQEALLKTKDPKIQKVLNELRQSCDCEDEFMFYLKQGVRNLARVVLNADFEEIAYQEVAIDVLTDLLKYIHFRKKPLYFRVDLQNCGVKAYRKLMVPASASLADLAYLTILAFGGDGGHLFSFSIDGIRFDDCLYSYGDEELASDIDLCDIDFEMVRTMKLLYDFGEGWEFSFRHLKRGQGDSDIYPNGYVFAGEGPNIWEDNRYFYEMYSVNPKLNLMAELDENICLEAYAKRCDEMHEFDIENCNDVNLSFFDNVKQHHENQNLAELYDDGHYQA